MKQRALIAFVFMFGCATGGVAAQLVVPSVRAGTSPTRWEYECVTSDEDETRTLNQLGAQGWELASMSPAVWHGGYSREVDKYTVCAKRALP